jgi:hypothetical protein
MNDMNCDCFADDGIEHHHILHCPICGTPTTERETNPGAIDRKFQFVAFNHYNHKRFTEVDGIVFLAKDKLVVPMLETYLALVGRNVGWASPEAEAVKLMIERVVAYQKRNPEICKLPDLMGGAEVMELTAPNAPGERHSV